MKRQTVIGPLLVVAMAGGIYSESALAHEGRTGRHDAPGDCREHEHRGRGGNLPARMAEELGLSAEQKTQIGKILDAERVAGKPLLKKLREAREGVREAGETAAFNEAAIRAAVAKENALRTELMVSHARTRSRINAILTAEQREAAEELLSAPMHRPGREPLRPEEF